jgi:hypothetical protein
MKTLFLTFALVVFGISAQQTTKFKHLLKTEPSVAYNPHSNFTMDVLAKIDLSIEDLLSENKSRKSEDTFK